MASLSVVIPTYNASRFIQGTLDSVFAQTRLPDEVVVVDDCSPDDTVAVVDWIARKSPVPVRVIRLPKNSGGPAVPLNQGVAASEGDLIATLDHDDRFEPRHVEMQVDLLSRVPNADLCLCEVLRTAAGPDTGSPRDGSRLTLPPDVPRTPVGPSDSLIPAADAHRALAIHGCFAATCSSFVFRKRLWQGGVRFDERNTTCVDFAFLTEATKRGDVAYVNEPLVTFVTSEGSLYASAREERRLRDELRVYRRMTSAGWDGSTKALYRERMAGLYYDWAYHARQAGYYFSALTGYVRSNYYRLSRRAVGGAIKLLPHWAWNRAFGRARVLGTHGPTPPRPAAPTLTVGQSVHQAAN